MYIQIEKVKTATFRFAVIVFFAPATDGTSQPERGLTAAHMLRKRGQKRA